jgi:hypothetical protein
MVLRKGNNSCRGIDPFLYKAVSHLLVLIFIGFLAAPAWAADDIRKEPIRFKKGASSATVKGRIMGYQAVDYVLGARAGQTMSVSLKTNSGANYFIVLPPGSDAAIASGETLGNKWSGTLPADGEYKIRVYLMRSAARRNETANYTLSVGITGRPDAKVGGTPYHATGTVPCSVGTDPKGSVQCSFGVIRGEQGKAEVYLAAPGYDVKLHRDKLRILRFDGGTVTSADASEKVKFDKQGDNWSIGVNDFYFFTIPEAVILGG